MKTQLFTIALALCGSLNAQTITNQKVITSDSAQVSFGDYDIYTKLSSGLYYSESSYAAGLDRTLPGYGNSDVWIARLDEDLNVTSEILIGGEGYERLRCMDEFYNGDLLLAIRSNSTVSGNITTPNFPGQTETGIIFRTTSNGDIIWERRLGGTGSFEYIQDVYMMNDTVVILSASSSEPSIYKQAQTYGWVDYWLVMLDPNGNVILDKSFGGGDFDYAQSLLVVDNNIYISGVSFEYTGTGLKTSPAYGKSDIWLIKVDMEGNFLGQTTLGGSEDEDYSRLAYKSDGSFYLVCESKSGISGNKTTTNYGGTDYWVVELDTSLNILNQKEYGGEGFESMRNLRYAYGNYHLMGSSSSVNSTNLTLKNEGNSDVLYAIFDEDFDLVSSISLGSDAGDGAYETYYSVPGKLTIGGLSFSGVGGDKTAPNYLNRAHGQGWIIQMDVPLSTEGGMASSHLLELYPNPATDALHLQIPDYEMFNQLKISDINGRVVVVYDLEPNTSILLIDVSNLQTGTYFCHLKGQKIQVSERFVID